MRAVIRDARGNQIMVALRARTCPWSPQATLGYPPSGSDPEAFPVFIPPLDLFPMETGLLSVFKGAVAAPALDTSPLRFNVTRRSDDSTNSLLVLAGSSANLSSELGHLSRWRAMRSMQPIEKFHPGKSKKVYPLGWCKRIISS